MFSILEVESNSMNYGAFESSLSPCKTDYNNMEFDKEASLSSHFLYRSLVPNQYNLKKKTKIV